MNGPLAGIRVVELSTFITAPLTGVMLADICSMYMRCLIFLKQNHLVVVNLIFPD